jgi:hypothetical protein
MEPVEQVISAPQVANPASPPITEDGELAARRTLRAQIARLEQELSGAFLTVYEMGAMPPRHDRVGEPRLLDLGGLERVRDELAERLRCTRLTISSLAEVQEANRLRLERMLLEPGKYRFARVSRSDLGEPGCGVWQVRPRMGLIGMLMGWWQVKLSSGCPLPRGRGGDPRP